MVPLDRMQNFSLTHKVKKESKVADLDALRQGVPYSTSQTASLTVEAALVFPVFLFVMIGLLFFFRVLQVTRITSGVLASTGSQMAVEAGTREVSVGEAVLRFQKELQEAECPVEYILGGRMGISWQGSTVEGAYMDLRISYWCKLPIAVPGMNHIPIGQRIKLRKWIGADSSTGQEVKADTWVYITEEGTVYHRRRDCTHLNLSIQSLGKETAMSRYDPCDICSRNASVKNYYYVTEDGEKYHTTLECRGLKRTVYMIRLSETDGKSACQRCGGVA